MGRVKVRLQIDWQALGLDPAKARLTAPPIMWFQPAAELGVGKAVEVEMGKGWVVVCKPH